MTTTRARAVGVRSVVATLLWSLVLLFVAAFAVSYVWPIIRPTEMLVFAHHGDLQRWPENSLEGVVAAMELGPDGIEIDVRESASGTFWMFHDELVDVVTGGEGLVRDLQDDQLAQLRFDGGPGFDPSRHADVRLATLDEGLEVLGRYDGLVMVDLKDSSIPAHGRLAEVVAEHFDPERVYMIVQSLDGARLVKAVDERFTTLYRNVATWDAAIDAWIAHAEVQVRWPVTTLADLFGSTVMYIEGTFQGDETDLLENGRRWGVDLVITNDIKGTMAWKAGRR